MLLTVANLVMDDDSVNPSNVISNVFIIRWLTSVGLILTICISCGVLVTVQYAYSEKRQMPVEGNLGLNIVARSSGLFTTIKEPTYGRIIYPSSVSPFNFAVEPSSSVSGSPFIFNSK
jgi:hypothetical protein